MSPPPETLDGGAERMEDEQPMTSESHPKQTPDKETPRPLLSVLMPVFNEARTIETIIERVLAVDIDKELLMVDDGSTDGTRDWLRDYEGRAPDNVRVFYHKKNKGKGAAIQTALAKARGRILIIQDADLEYQPEEYPLLVNPILKGLCDVAYGSRFLGAHRSFLGTHYYGNKFVTFVTNILFNTCLTDMETCYKCFRAEVFDKVKLRSNRFNIEPEITAKVFKNKFRVMEIPITYTGRDFDEGKKITWRDGFCAIWALIKFRFVD